MNQKNEIISAIKNGMKQACADMHSFTDKPELAFNAEYLFTVATAKAIDAHNFIPACVFEVRIEHNTRQFARDCLPLIKKGHPMVKGSSLLRENVSPKISRPGRIDIAIYYESLSKPTIGRKPLCAIEVKGFDPSRNLVMQDLKRNLELMRVSGRTGTSILEFTVFAALHSGRAKNESEVTAEIKEIKQKYKGWMAGLGARNDLIEEIDTFTTSWVPEGTVYEEYDELIIDPSSRHHFLGVIVTFSKPNILP